jgi:cytochrome c oxidase subunit 1
MNSYPGKEELPDGFVLDMPEEQVRRLSTGWLLLALGSLVVGGLLTIVIVLSRTPFIQDVLPWLDIFHTALVVHVDMTVLVWFLSMAGVFWSINSKAGCCRCGWAALTLCTAGSAILALSPFLGAGGPMMTNYVPVLQDSIFFTGLILFGLGFLVLVLRGLVFSRPIGILVTGQGALRFGLYSALVSSVVAIGALFASYFDMPETTEGERFFELLFWGGGHTIQFVHIQLMLVSWLWLATVSGITSRLTPRVVLFLFIIGLVPVLLTPLVYLNFDIDSGDHIQTMTWLMQYGGGLAALPIGLIILVNLVNTFRSERGLSAERSSLLSSMILFGVGGLIGFMIQGSNVTVPAHYHGSIVAVTLAYMGVTYHILPLLGFRKPVGRMAVLQPWFYGTGQLMHVLGLAWSGGYGVQRKVAGESQILDGIEKVAGMGLMGLGGLIAVIGGVLFLIVVFRAMWVR